jgi:hypothetical protein
MHLDLMVCGGTISITCIVAGRVADATQTPRPRTCGRLRTFTRDIETQIRARYLTASSLIHENQFHMVSDQFNCVLPPWPTVLDPPKQHATPLLVCEPTLISSRSLEINLLLKMWSGHSAFKTPITLNDGTPRHT